MALHPRNVRTPLKVAMVSELGLTTGLEITLTETLLFPFPFFDVTEVSSITSASSASS